MLSCLGHTNNQTKYSILDSIMEKKKKKRYVLNSDTLHSNLLVPFKGKKDFYLSNGENLLQANTAENTYQDITISCIHTKLHSNKY